MPYIIETWDRPGSQSIRQQTRGAHLEYLLQHQSLLLACGAKLADDGTDLGGGLYVLDVATRAEAAAFIAADPFTEADLFERVQITRWRKAFVDGRFLL